MAGNWGSQNFGGSYDDRQNSLQGVIELFPPRLKQAMFAAASRTTIKRRNWNGCAMNAAGIEIGKADSVQSFDSAAQAFGIPPSLVENFVERWDRLDGTDEECTQHLRTMIEKAGLFSKPGKGRRGAPIQVFTSSKLRKKFDTMVEHHIVPDEDVALSILDGSLAGV